MLKIVALSDLHGQLINVTESADLFIICGDISPLEIQRDRRELYAWMMLEFGPWVDKLPYKTPYSKCVFIAGNHDFILEMAHGTDFRGFSKRLIYLDNDELLFANEGKTYNIFGCPYCRELKGWAFCKDDETLKRYYEFIPEDLDVLVLHDAPDINNAGVATEYHNRNFGNKVLAEYVKKVKPKLTLFGHIHTSPIKEPYGFEEGCTICNVSILDEDYKIRYEPKVFYLD